MNQQPDDPRTSTPGEAVAQRLRYVLSDVERRENILSKSQARQAQLVELGMLDVDLARLLAEASDTEEIEGRIRHYERQLGMK